MKKHLSLMAAAMLSAGIGVSAASEVKADSAGGLLATSAAVGTAESTTTWTSAQLAPRGYWCRLTLEQGGRQGDFLWIKIESNTSNKTADVLANFEKAREERDQRQQVQWGPGGGTVTVFRIPERARSVYVRVRIDVDHGRVVMCSGRLGLV